MKLYYQYLFGFFATAMIIVSEKVVNAVTWTEMFVPYNGGNPDDFGEKGPYELDDPLRQHLHLLTASSNEKTPVYFFAHSNGAKASQLREPDLDIISGEGYSVISWESVTYIGPENFEVCTSDFDLVWKWFLANADKYKFDTKSVIIGGRSRGSVCSWSMAHSAKEEINGIYMYNALPDGAWKDTNVWVELVTSESPPAYLVYGPECDKPITQDCETNPPDGHNPRHGQKIVDRYTDLGIGSIITLTDGLTKRKEGVFDYFPDFVRSRTTAAPTPAQKCEGLSKKACKADDNCAFGKGKLKVDCQAKKTSFVHDCSQYSLNDCTSDNANTKNLCEIKDGACTHVCDGESNKTCKKKKDAGNKKKVCTNKVNNPCKKCKPKSCSA